MGEIRPILKWAGGKSRLLPKIRAAVPKKFSTYYEPFVGGGSVLFGIRPSSAVINDINEEIINLYKVVRDNPRELIRRLNEHKAKDCADYFYQIRDEDRDEYYRQRPAVERAARVVYLNRTCFNGLFRVNAKGYFNVPYGRYIDPTICDVENIMAVSEYLNTALVRMHHGDFESMLAGAGPEDFVYMDPPYVPLNGTSNFTGYAMLGFSMDDQRRLKETCDRLTQRGVRFLQSNSYCDAVLDMYKGYNIRTVMMKRSINSKGDGRGAVKEVLISNY